MLSAQGNDGGTILRRKDVIRAKEGEAKANVDPALLARIVATTCALSKQLLSAPIVSDALGRLYNKDSVVKYLLARAESTDAAQSSRTNAVAGHLRGLKDIKELRLTPNPSFSSTEVDTEDDNTPFICPLSQRQMNGRHRFVYLAPCGCVMSESGLRGTLSDDVDTADCPVCGTKFSTKTLGRHDIQPGGDVIIINGTSDEVQEMRRCMEKHREAEKARKKKNRSANSDDPKHHKHEEKRKRKQEDALLESKKSKVDSSQAVINAGELARQAKNQVSNGKNLSPALRSLYGYDKPQSVQ